jgi:protein CpxP
MKKLLLICVAVIGIAGVSRAQGGGGGGRQQKSPAEQAAALKTTLSLTDDQTTKVTAIYEASAKSNDSLRTAMAGGDRAAMRPAMMTIRTATNAKIKAILTPDQAATFQKGLDAQAARMQGGGGNGGGGGGGGGK